MSGGPESGVPTGRPRKRRPTHICGSRRPGTRPPGGGGWRPAGRASRALLRCRTPGDVRLGPSRPATERGFDGADITQQRGRRPVMPDALAEGVIHRQAPAPSPAGRSAITGRGGRRRRRRGGRGVGSGGADPRSSTARNSAARISNRSSQSGRYGRMRSTTATVDCSAAAITETTNRLANS